LIETSELKFFKDFLTGLGWSGQVPPGSQAETKGAGG